MRPVPFRPARLLPAVLPVLLAACGSPPGQPVASFGSFTPSAERAHYLACPVNYCLGPVDATTEFLPVNADRMRAVVRQAIEAQPRTVLVATSNEGLKQTYQQRSALWGFTDTITIDIVDGDESESGIAIYSQSDRGSVDGGANERRVKAWLAAIAAAAAAASK